jgi:hypothetical protein
MKKQMLLLQFLIGNFSLLISGNSFAENNQGVVTHVVLVWLKEPGNKVIRNQFIKESRTLNDLPGIIYRHVGEVLPTGRKIADDTFDVAITATLKNEQALKAYLEHPKHKQIIEKKLKPLINRAVAYDFISK